jgi:hypothetical protein
MNQNHITIKNNGSREKQEKEVLRLHNAAITL